MNLPLHNKIDISSLGKLFSNMSESYKIFWFKAIIEKVHEGKKLLSYDELVNKMIADAWYMVAEYKLNLGPSDTLEKLVAYAYSQSELLSNASESTILNYLHSSKDLTLVSFKRTLILNVPYRLQSPFLKDFTGSSWKGSLKSVANSINQTDGLIYKFDTVNGLNSTIIITDIWFDYINTNYEIIKGWVDYNLIIYLQRRNPNIPGIPLKITPPQERKLDKVKKYWSAIIETTPIAEIYTGTIMEKSDISIDHFIPWSYVAHDELWNLSPTLKIINSSKNNNLPDWNMYFGRLCELEYIAYKLTQEKVVIRELFEKCAREHINDPYVFHKLYTPNIEKYKFYSLLEETMLPIYTAAKNAGFNEWRL